MAAATKAHAGDVVGRAARDFSQDASTAFIGTSVFVDVTVYKNSGAAEDIMKAAKSAFEAQGFVDCFKEIMTEDEGGLGGADLKISAVSAQTKAPNSGLAQAFEMSAASGGISFAFHFEIYAWRDNDALAYVAFIGSKEAVTGAVVSAGVSKTQSKLAAAH